MLSAIAGQSSSEKVVPITVRKKRKLSAAALAHLRSCAEGKLGEVTECVESACFSWSILQPERMVRSYSSCSFATNRGADCGTQEPKQMTGGTYD